jgi:hypothetical protein
MTKPQKPVGQPTRGKTARNRLRRVDIFLTRYDPNLIRQMDADDTRCVYLDLGYGFEPTTTLESAQRFHKLNPKLYTIGVEIDPQRVSAATPHISDRTDFRQGGFNLPLKPNEMVRLIRAFNVLRQYAPEQVAEAYHVLSPYLIEGGLLIEGTSDPFGRIWTANLIRKQKNGGIHYEGLIFSTNFRKGFDPGIFQPVLPKNLIHQMENNSQINPFFDDWKAVAAATIGFKQYGLRQWFTEAAFQLSLKGYKLDLRKKMLKSGFLTWKNPDLDF